MTKAFDVVAKRINKTSSAVGMHYYNSLRKELSDGDSIKEQITFTDEDRQLLLEEVRDANKGKSAWTKDEQEVVLEAVRYVDENYLQRGEAWEIAHKRLPHRTPAAISRHYYTVLKDAEEKHNESSSEVAQEVIQEVPSQVVPRLVDVSGSTVVEAISELPNLLEDLDRKIKHIESIRTVPTPESIIEALTLLLKNTRAGGNVEEELERTIKENEELTNKLTKLSAENQLLKAKLEKIKTHYEDAVLLFDMFTNMASISQIMGLGDFKKQMRTTIDKWGNVLKVEVV